MKRQLRLFKQERTCSIENLPKQPNHSEGAIRERRFVLRNSNRTPMFYLQFQVISAQLVTINFELVEVGEKSFECCVHKLQTTALLGLRSKKNSLQESGPEILEFGLSMKPRRPQEFRREMGIANAAQSSKKWFFLKSLKRLLQFRLTTRLTGLTSCIPLKEHPPVSAEKFELNLSSIFVVALEVQRIRPFRVFDVRRERQLDATVRPMSEQRSNCSEPPATPYGSLKASVLCRDVAQETNGVEQV